MMLGVSALGTECLGGGSLDEVIIEAIKVSTDIPSDAKEAIKDFIKESFQDLLWDTFEELLDLQPPIELMEYWDLVVELIQKLIS